MRGRVLVLVATSAAVMFGMCAQARAQELEPTTFDEAAASDGFPVWKPSRALGMRATPTAGDCEDGGVSRSYLFVNYREPHSKQRLSIVEYRPICGNPGEARFFKYIRIHGARASLEVGCGTLACRPRYADGFRNGFQIIVKLPARRSAQNGRPRHTWLVANSRYMRLGPLLRLLRSARVVRVDRPRVQLSTFLSSDGTVLCGIGLRNKSDRFCSTQTPNYGAIVDRDGTVNLCGAAQPADPLCIQNWDTELPRLRDGQRSDVGGYVCLDQAGAITCTVKSGAVAGRGFHVDVNGSEVVGPAP